MGRILPALVCSLVLAMLGGGVASASGTAVAKDEYCDFLVVSAATIHSRPGPSYPVIGRLPAGRIVSALRRPIQRFHLLGQGGYVAAGHLELVEEPARCG